LIGSRSGISDIEIGGPNSLVCFLSRRRFVFIFPDLQIIRAVILFDSPSNVSKCLIAQGNGIGSHITDVTRFVEPLSHDHGPFYVKIQFSACLLLEGGGRKWCRWFPGQWLYFYAVNGKLRRLTILQKLPGLLDRAKPPPMLSFEFYPFTLLIPNGENRRNLKEIGDLECIDFPFSLHHQFHSHRLNPSGAQIPFDLFPKDRRS